ncbi:hypothetical protein [Bradymonas sediminis]|uniref:hypothetical protein n=1 Tax=Bradymonas sediminis TaxID=1548548 RepID=UPI00105E323E|nr:hypothetical protein [Bradymonas sediminis]
MKNSTDAQAQPEKSPASRQRLLPLFALASAMMVLGYYLAITQSADPNKVEPVEHLEDSAQQIAPLEINDEGVDTSIRGVRFAYAPLDARRSTLELRQDSKTVEAQGESVGLRTQIALNFEEVFALRSELLAGDADEDLPEMFGVAEADAAIDPNGKTVSPDALAATRTYTDVRAAVHTVQEQNSGLLGKNISAQVAGLLQGSVTRTFLQPNGENIDFEWRNVPNPEARRILYLVRDSQAFLTPRFTADALNPGDTWSYERPLWVDPDDKKMHAEGTVTISNRFVGTLEVDGRQLGVIRQTLDGHADGEVRASASTKFAMKGSGSGIFLVDLKDGSRVAADLDFERTLTVDNGGEPAVQSSKIALKLRPSGGIKLPKMLQAAREIDGPAPPEATP